MSNGCQLAWPIDIDAQTVYVYRPDQPRETRTEPGLLSDESVLPGFTLNLSQF